MPERWERELERLAEIDAPVSTRARIEEGPHYEAVPPSPGRSQRIVAGVVAFAVFGGALAFALGAFGDGDGPTIVAPSVPEAVVVTFDVRREQHPSASMAVGGRTFEAFGTSYCFEFEGGGICADTVAPEDYESINGPWEYIPVVAGAPIQVAGTAASVDAEVLDAVFAETGQLPLPDGQGAVPDELGKGFLVFHATWPEGDRYFYFAINVVPADGVEPLVLAIDMPPPQDGVQPGPSFTASYRGTTVDLDAIETPGPDLYYPSVRFPLPIPVGTPLQIDHGATNVDVFLLERAVGEFVAGDNGARTVGDPIDALPSEPGLFAFYVLAEWPGAVGGMGLEVDLFDPDTISGSPAADALPQLLASLEVPNDGTLPSLALRYGDTEEEFGAQGGDWPGVGDYFIGILYSFSEPVAPGTTLSLAGDVSTVEGELRIAQGDGSLADDTIPLDLPDGVAILPTEVGNYEMNLSGTWPRGTAAFFVRIQIGEPEVDEPSPLPEVEAGIVPDVAGMFEGDAQKLLLQAGFESATRYVVVIEAPVGMVAGTEPPAGSAPEPGGLVILVVSGTTVSFDGYLTPLACSSTDMMPFVDADARLQPAGESYIRVNVAGILPSDVLAQVLDDPGDDLGRGPWNLIRDGDVLAVIDWETLQGIACRGSGIGRV